MKQFIYKVAIGLAVMTCLSDAASAQTIFRGMRSGKTNNNFKSPVVYSLRRADTSLSFDQNTSRVNRDAKRNNSIIKTDSVAKKDSAVSAIIFAQSFARDKTTSKNDSSFNALTGQLTIIQDELQDIKTVLRNQALIPRYRYLQYQLDSLQRLSYRISLKPALQTSDRLQVRVYQLQQDSLRNQMQKLMWMSQYPAKDFDSSVLNFSYPDLQTGYYPGSNGYLPMNPGISYRSPEMNTDTVYTVDTVYATDTADAIDTAYRIIGSDKVNRLAANDSESNVKNRLADSLYMSRISYLQRRLDSLSAEDKIQYDSVLPEDRTAVNNSDTAMGLNTLKRRGTEEIRDTVGNSDPARNDDRVRTVDTAGTVDTSINRYTVPELQKNMDSVNNRLRAGNDSMAMLQASLKSARDSAAYYRRTIYAMDLDPSDTIVEKKKWYNRIIPARSKERVEEQDVATLKTYTVQESYFANQAKTMSDDIERLQRDNQNLKNDYDRLRRNRDDRYVRQAPATVIQSAGSLASQRELSALRREISEMRQQMLQGANGAANRDTVIMQMPQTQVAAVQSTPGRDSVQISNLQTDLAALRTQLDSIKRIPPPVVA
ncbi:MAG: hypothetical protein EOO00_07085, partial [Chitinophagaceae bacterium]